MLHIGISTSCLYPQLTENAFQQCALLGFEAIEVFFNTESELSGPVFDLISDYKREYHISVPAVHPYSSCVEPFLLFSRYERRFQDGVEYYKKFFDAANRLGAGIVTIHGGRPTGHLSTAEYSERFAALRAEGKKQGVIVAQENVNGYRSQSPDVLRDMRRYLNEDIDFVFDVKQSVRAGYGPEAILNAMGDRVTHVHLSDHTAEKDCLPPGKGSCDFKKIFSHLDRIGYDGYGMIELYRENFIDPLELKTACRFLDAELTGKNA